MSINSAYWKKIDVPDEHLFQTIPEQRGFKSEMILDKFSLIPMQSGEIVINPIKLDISYYYYNPNIDPVEAFFNDNYLDKYLYNDTTITSNSLTIQVDNRQMPDNSFKVKKPSKPLSLGIVVDKSTSLLQQEDSISDSFMKLEYKLYEALRKDLEKSLYSVTVFAGIPHYPSSSEIIKMEFIKPSEGKDGSAVYDGILAAALRDGALTRDHQAYSILLLTDGKDNSSRVSENTLINLLLQNNIRVDVIAFASKKDSLIMVHNDSIGTIKTANDQDYSDVERIAKATNGLFCLVENERDIQGAIARIKESLIMAETPKAQPEQKFKPNIHLLDNLYKSIMMDAKTTF